MSDNEKTNQYRRCALCNAVLDTDRGFCDDICEWLKPKPNSAEGIEAITDIKTSPTDIRLDSIDARLEAIERLLSDVFPSGAGGQGCGRAPSDRP